MQTNPSVEQAYALPQAHRERLAATIQAVIDWRRDKAHEAEDAYQDKWARERSNRAFFALKILRTFVLFSLPDDDPDLGTFRYSAPQGDRYRICPEAWDLLSRFCMARGNLQASGGKPTEAQMRNVLRRAEGSEQQARADERRADYRECTDLAGLAGIMWRGAKVVAVVAVTASDVEVLPAEPVDECERLEALCSTLSVENEHLWDEVFRLTGENERLRGRVGKLEGSLEEARRAGKRQAAPFSRGEPKSAPRRPGRRSGEEHGRHGHREPQGEVDEHLDAPLEPRCECGGEIVEDRTEYQFQDELPEPRPIRRRFAVHIGKCACCGARHQGRHPFQTSDALGAAGCMLGPRAVALATELNKELGLSPQKTAKALARFGIRVSAGGVVQAIARQARTLEPTYQALVEGVRSSAAVAPDETGWRINGQKAWLWAFAGEDVTVYLIAAGRGYEHAAEILGEDYSGVLERDGWAPYRRFTLARHQTCHAHLLRRTGELIADSRAGQARVPHAVRRILKDALALRDQRDVIDAAQFGLKVTDLNERAEELLAMRPTHEPNRKLLAHLQTEREHLFTFLTEPGVQATNWRAEQALRPAIVNRKSWGGNRTQQGARTQQVTMSVIRTARQQQVDPIELMATAQRTRTPAVSERLKFPPARSDPELLAA